MPFLDRTAVQAWSGFRASSTIWTNEMNARLSDNAYATVTLGASAYSYYLISDIFNFHQNIPAGSVIDGIEVRIERKASVASRLVDHEVRLTAPALDLTHNKAKAGLWESTDTTIVYGSPTDKWGKSSITYDDLVSWGSDFGVAIVARNTTGSSTIAYVDAMLMRLYYTEASAGNPIMLGCNF